MNDTDIVIMPTSITFAPLGSPQFAIRNPPSKVAQDTIDFVPTLPFQHAVCEERDD